jgi:hypothetical protein
MSCKTFGFFKKVLFLAKIFFQLEVSTTGRGQVALKHPKGLLLTYTPQGTDGNILPELYFQFSGALLESSVVLSVNHDGSRPWQEPAAYEKKDEQKEALCNVTC